MSFKGATQAQLDQASYAWCDSHGEARTSEFVNKGAKNLAKGNIPYPEDLAAMTGRAEALTSDGQHIIVDLYIDGTTPVDPISSVVFFSTLEIPPDPKANATTRRVIDVDFPTVQAGTFTADIPDGSGGANSISVTRDRLPSGATNVVWTEGPFNVPTKVVAGRDPVRRLIAQGLGEI